jgi:hypothetical protein
MTSPFPALEAAVTVAQTPRQDGRASNDGQSADLFLAVDIADTVARAHEGDAPIDHAAASRELLAKHPELGATAAQVEATLKHEVG